MPASSYVEAVVRHNLARQHGTVTRASTRAHDAYLLHVTLPGGATGAWLSEECEIISRPRAGMLAAEGGAR